MSDDLVAAFTRLAKQAQAPAPGQGRTANRAPRPERLPDSDDQIIGQAPKGSLSFFPAPIIQNGTPNVFLDIEAVVMTRNYTDIPLDKLRVFSAIGGPETGARQQPPIHGPAAFTNAIQTGLSS
jgi:hypothetical protein